MYLQPFQTGSDGKFNVYFTTIKLQTNKQGQEVGVLITVTPPPALWGWQAEVPWLTGNQDEPWELALHQEVAL